jgi:hypothetical protein
MRIDIPISNYYDIYSFIYAHYGSNAQRLENYENTRIAIDILQIAFIIELSQESQPRKNTGENLMEKFEKYLKNLTVRNLITQLLEDQRQLTIEEVDSNANMEVEYLNMTMKVLFEKLASMGVDIDEGQEV